MFSSTARRLSGNIQYSEQCTRAHLPQDPRAVSPPTPSSAEGETATRLERSPGKALKRKREDHLVGTPPSSGTSDSARKRAAAWLETLPKPVAVFAANDKFARICADAAAISGFKVPDDVAILGVDDDDLVCETAAPELSSILVDFRACGYKAAKLLDRVMKEGARHPMAEMYEPLDVVPAHQRASGKTNWRYARALVHRPPRDGRHRTRRCGWSSAWRRRKLFAAGRPSRRRSSGEASPRSRIPRRATAGPHHAECGFRFHSCASSYPWRYTG